MEGTKVMQLFAVVMEYAMVQIVVHAQVHILERNAVNTIALELLTVMRMCVLGTGFVILQTVVIVLLDIQETTAR